MKSVIMVILLAGMYLATTTAAERKKCEFKAIFNFGDSNTDTGGFTAALPPQLPPYGMTYFKKPAGRVTDGRVILDFLAQGLGLPFVSPYLQSIGSDYRHGANFAIAASTVILPQTSIFGTRVSPFVLEVQLNQMKEFKAKVEERHRLGTTNLPSPDIFGKSLYTIYMAQNDFTGTLAALGIGALKELLPQVVGNITTTIKEIYGLGGRTILVLNLAPIGCYPKFLVQLPHNSSDIDEFGCMIPYNNLVVDYNNMLKSALAQTRREIADANLVYVDTHAVILDLIQHPTSHGLKYGTKACCGYGGGDYNFNLEVFCGETKQVNGTTVTAEACEDPQNYVSFDGIHTTDAANKIIASAILYNGFNYLDPPNFSLHNFCDIHPIGSSMEPSISSF